MTCFEHAFRAMGSPCSVQGYAANAAEAQCAFDAAVACVERLEARYSRYRDDSLTSRINRAAGTGEWVTVDAETVGLIDYAARAWQTSEGLFDLTSGVLRQAWDFRRQQLPEQAQIDDLLPLIGWAQVEWDAPRIRLPRWGMELDFGGMVKEYAADAAAAALRAAGIAHGLVELGGDIAVAGPHPDGSGWRVGVRDPALAGQAMAAIELRSGGLASSGDYERGITVGGVRYGHILDPRNGWPVQGLRAVSIAAPQCLVAGSASTIALLKGSDGVDWLAALELPYVAVDQAGGLHGGWLRQ